MQPGPCRLIAAEPQFPLEPKRADAVLLAGDEPHGQEPRPQRLTGSLEDRPGSQRGLSAADPTSQPTARHCPWLLRRTAMGADEPAGPTQTADVAPARFVVAEPLVQRRECLRVINPAYRMLAFVHPPCISPKIRGMKGIPIFAFFSPCRPAAGIFPARRPNRNRLRRPAELLAHCS